MNYSLTKILLQPENRIGRNTKYKYGIKDPNLLTNGPALSIFISNNCKKKMKKKLV